MSKRLNDAAEMLWVVLANVSGGDWSKQSPEWQEAAARVRDDYFAAVERPEQKCHQHAWVTDWHRHERIGRICAFCGLREAA